MIAVIIILVFAGYFGALVAIERANAKEVDKHIAPK